MKKKLLSSLCLLLTGALFVGCGSTSSPSTNGNTSTGTGTTASQGGGSSTPTNEAPLPLNVMIWDRGNSFSGTTPEDNATSRFIKESVLAEYNVDVTFVSVPRSGSDDVVNVMMAGGNAPDLVYTYSRNLFGDYALKGGLTDLSSYVAEFGPNIQATLGDDILSVGVIDGKQYSIPAKRNTQKIKHTGYIRKDWVEAMGMSMPTNKAELIEVLYAFKEQDPGNVGANLVPWAMGGTQDSEKFYLSFVGSYADISSEKDLYLYPGASRVTAPGTVEGLRVMNQLYNDGIIKKDFAVDTSDEIYRQDIANGYAGFIVEDSTRPIDGLWVEALLSNDPSAEFVPINIFDHPDGTISTPADPLYGMYIMVPKVSEKRAEAAVKYLDWLAQIPNSMAVMFGEGYAVTEAGVPIPLSNSEREAQGLAATPNDFTTITQYWDYSGNLKAVASEWASAHQYLSQEYFENLFETVTSHKYNEPVFQDILSSETRYLNNLNKLMIEFAYKSISAPTANFDATYQSEYNKLFQSGLQEVLDERGAYYDNNVAK
jgi:putative aldouronate transport system substrate-binding protein